MEQSSPGGFLNRQLHSLGILTSSVTDLIFLIGRQMNPELLFGGVPRKSSWTVIGMASE